MPKWLVWTLVGCLGLGILICAGCGFAGYYFFNMFRDIVSSQQQFTRHLQEKNADAAYAMLSSDARSKITGDKFKAQVLALHAKYGPLKQDPSEPEMNIKGDNRERPDSISGEYRLLGPKQTVIVRTTSVQENGKWVIGHYEFAETTRVEGSEPSSKPATK